MTTTAFARALPDARVVTTATPGDPALGPLADLPGTWRGVGRGWNLIALPFDRTASGGLNYRLLLNQFDEELSFDLVDEGVPNRGLDPSGGEADQHAATLDYTQIIRQVAATDQPPSDLAGAPGAFIHHEPGLFLALADRVEGDPDVARLATIPHGDAVLALGTSAQVIGRAPVPPVSGLPVGSVTDLDDPYLAPYKHFHDTPFVGTVTGPFPGFDPTEPQKLLEIDVDTRVDSTTVLDLSTETATGGIVNIPFITAQAAAATMRSTFWIQHLTGGGLRLQYLQVVGLDFFPRTDGQPGRIRWPHITINTLEKDPAPQGQPAPR